MARDYSEVIKTITALSADVQRDAEELEPELFHEKRAEAVTRLMEKGGFAGKDAPFRYAPDSAKREAYGRYQAEVEGRLANRLALLADSIDVLTKVGPAHEALAAEPPSAVDAFALEHKLASVERGQAVHLAILDELRLARLEPKILALPPSAILARYEAALERPSEGESAAVIRLVEQFAASKRLPLPKKTEEAGFLPKLEKRIAEARDARVPAGLKVWREAVKRGRKTLTMADAGGIKPRKAQS
jgi:hypothetical protein